MSATNSPRSDQPLMIGIRGLALALNRSVASIQRDDKAGRIPAPMKIGGSKLWRRKEIRAWIEAGCPERTSWESRFTK